MTALPRHLAQWADILSLFSQDLVLPFGDLLLRLDALLGAKEQTDAENQDVAGFDGFSRRAPLSRLVPSEWLLQQEVPTEFVRRFDQHELSYFQLAYEAPKQSRTHIVLVDAGPQQLGRPRIAQLALVILLARRAKESHTEFYWGAIHEDVLHTEITRATVQAFLAARTLDVTKPSTLIRRHRMLEQLNRGAEFSVVGSSRGIADWVDASQFSIDEEVSADGTTRLRVARWALKPERFVLAKEMLVDMPSDETCVKLLRDPFETRVRRSNSKPRVQIDPESQIAFRGDGGVAYVLGTKGELISFSVPRGPGAGAKKRTLPRYQQHRFWGVGTNVDGGPVAISEYNGDNYLLKLTGNGGQVVSTVNLGRGSGDEGTLLRERKLLTVLVADSRVMKSRSVIAAHYHRIVSFPGLRIMSANRHGIAATLTVNGSIAWFANDPSAEVRVVYQHNDAELHALSWDRLGWSSKPEYAYSGAAFLSRDTLAFKTEQDPTRSASSDAWAISDRLVYLAHGFEVVGLATGKYPSGQFRPCVIAVPESRISAWMFGPEYMAHDGVGLELFRTHSRIASITTCPFAKIIAFTTEDGGFGIYSTPLEKMLFQSSPKDHGDD